MKPLITKQIVMFRFILYSKVACEQILRDYIQCTETGCSIRGSCIQKIVNKKTDFIEIQFSCYRIEPDFQYSHRVAQVLSASKRLCAHQQLLPIFPALAPSNHQYTSKLRGLCLSWTFHIVCGLLNTCLLSMVSCSFLRCNMASSYIYSSNILLHVKTTFLFLCCTFKFLLWG